PMCLLHAQLSESGSARAGCDPAHPRNTRAVCLRTNLRCVVERECCGRCKSSRCAIGRTLSALDWSLGFLSYSHRLAAGRIRPVCGPVAGLISRLEKTTHRTVATISCIENPAARRQFVARRTQRACALSVLRIVRATFPRDSLQ